MSEISEHRERCERLQRDIAHAQAQGLPVTLKKSTSNLFRHRDRRGARGIDVRDFHRVLSIDSDGLTADVEGMTTYEELVAETLRHGLLPAVTPQLKTITVGGAVSGVGIESSSFRYGLVHETVEEMDIVTGDGRVITCSPTQNSDLFFGFPNSYGTLGYALRLRVKLIRAEPFLHLRHHRFDNPERFFRQLEAMCSAGVADFIDGAVFSVNEFYLTEARFCERAPRVSDYTYLRMYYRSVRSNVEDYMSARGYIWRWDTDWFWCSKHFGAQNPLVRLLATPWLLNSKTYQRLMRFGHGVLPDGGKTESVIQDVDIPLEGCVAFLSFLLSEVGITPVWVCPFRAQAARGEYPLYRFEPGRLYVNFGFWDTVEAREEPHYVNRKIERKVLELGGKKSLYSSVYYDRETFWGIYDREAYAALKSKYDPGQRFRDLHEKCVGRR
jgi:FAD/FMN-containing dehydrogenase